MGWKALRTQKRFHGQNKLIDMRNQRNVRKVTVHTENKVTVKPEKKYANNALKDLKEIEVLNSHLFRLFLSWR